MSDDEFSLINEQNKREDEDLPETGTSHFMSNLLDTTSNVALAFSTPSITISNPQNNRQNSSSILRPAHKRLRSSNSLDTDGGYKRPLLSDLNVNTDVDEEELLAPKNSVRFEKNHIGRSVSDFDAQYSPTLKNQAMSRRASLFVRRISMAIPSLSSDPIPQSVGFTSVPK